ncbi:MAG: xylulokinase [Termitinemataceae bacterium]|nr:MAG: xylulokinase [Termitinemataceae bacterium]
MVEKGRMSYLLGIDLGTSSLKALVVDSETGAVVSNAAEDYQFDSPISGYAEQDPQIWWNALVNVLQKVSGTGGVAPFPVSSLSFSGQMHGAVLMDEHYAVLRPVILHCDTRSSGQVSSLKTLFAEKHITAARFNPVYTGFLLPSLLWVRENEPGTYKKVRHVCLPKDYLKWRLCGVLNTDYSDASGTLLFDVENWCWSGEILEALNIDAGIFPPVCAATEQAGTIQKAVSDETGLAVGTAVVTGGADQLMQAIGNGAIAEGYATVNIGSSAQVCFQSKKLPEMVTGTTVTNTFCAASKGAWFTMGATMTAGLAFKWFTKNIASVSGYDSLDSEIAAADPQPIIFLPYLNGERTPHLNPSLRAAFLGMTLTTVRAGMARAVMEGIAFSLLDCINACAQLGLYAADLIASGGGARSSAWLQIQADIYGLPLKIACIQEQACIGAAAVAGIGCGIYKSLEDACEKLVHYKEDRYMPNMTRHKWYGELYKKYKAAYEANKELLSELGKL